LATAREHGRQPAPVAEIEQDVLSRIAHVRIDQQRRLAKLCKRHGKVGGEEAATIAALGTDDGERVAAGAAVEPAEHELGAKPTERLGLGD
jgi:hypothetical protein